VGGCAIAAPRLYPARQPPVISSNFSSTNPRTQSQAPSRIETIADETSTTIVYVRTSSFEGQETFCISVFTWLKKTFVFSQKFSSDLAAIKFPAPRRVVPSLFSNFQ